MDLLRVKFHLPIGKEYANYNDYRCALGIWSIVMTWFLYSFYVSTKVMIYSLGAHDLQQELMLQRPLYAPSIHICNRHDPSLLDLITVRSFQVHGDGYQNLALVDDNLRFPEDRCPWQRDVKQRFCRQFRFSPEAILSGSFIWYQVSWTCPCGRYVATAFAHFQNFSRLLAADAFTEKGSDKMSHDLAIAFDDYQEWGGDFFCRIEQKMRKDALQGSDPNPNITSKQRKILDLTFTIAALAEGLFEDYKAILQSVCRSTVMLDFNLVLADRQKRKLLVETTKQLSTAYESELEHHAFSQWLQEGGMPSDVQETCAQQFLQNSGVVDPCQAYVSRFSVRASLANYTCDPFGIEHETIAPLRLGLLKQPSNQNSLNCRSSKLKNTGMFQSMLSLAGTARTWRWKSTIGNRFRAPHDDTDYLQITTLTGGELQRVVADDADEDMWSRAGARISFVYMSPGFQETVLVNNIQGAFVNFWNTILSSTITFGILNTLCFIGFRPKHPKHFRWNCFGLGKKPAVPAKEENPSEIALTGMSFDA